MHKGLVLAIVAILGVSMVGVGHMTGSGNDNRNDWFSWWKNLDLKKFIGFMNSGGNDDDDDDDDDDDNGDNADQSPIDSASVSFNVEIRDIKVNDKPSFQNIIDQCIFHSKDSFSPLCIRCELLDADGEVLAKGEVKELKKSYKASDTISIPVFPDPKGVDPNDVQDVEGVNLVLCGFKKPGFFVGGGKVYVPKNGNIKSFTLTHGFELHCDPTLGPNNLEINWMKNKFHLEQLVTAKCYDDGSVNEPPPSPHPGPTLDVYYGKGYGRYNGQCGALAEWVMDDNGEPGKADQIVALRITYGTGVFEINPTQLGVTDTSVDNPLWLNLKTGNHQFVPHPASHPNPPTQTTPCPLVTP